MKKPDLRSLKGQPQQMREMASQLDPQMMQQAQQAVMQYQGKDEAALMEELASIAARERKNGNLSDERVDSIVGMLTPMLDPSQQQMLRSLQQQLKQG